MKQSARWTLTVSADVDRRVRRYLETAAARGICPRFVEEAVRARLAAAVDEDRADLFEAVGE